MEKSDEPRARFFGKVMRITKEMVFGKNPNYTFHLGGYTKKQFLSFFEGGKTLSPYDIFKLPKLGDGLDMLFCVSFYKKEDMMFFRQFACDCAERVLRWFKNPNKFVIETVKIARLFANGEIDGKKVRKRLRHREVFY